MANLNLTKKIDQVMQLCLTRGWTIGFAESCTGGLLSAQVAMAPGISRIFQGSVVSYSGDVKRGILEVPAHTIQTYGEVSEPVARYMARGARKHLICDWSVSITGIAGPGGGTSEKPVGTVFFAVAGPGFESSCRQNFTSGGREQIQASAVEFALDLLKDAMK
jgi:PncC family amidohydrolase